MFFSKLGRVVAYIVLALGTFRLILAFLIASNYLGPSAEATKRYLSGTKSTGEVIDQTIYACFLIIVLGVLCEISITLKAKSNSTLK